jgi:transposase
MESKLLIQESVGIDVSKATLSWGHCGMRSDLSKEFTLGEDVSNELSGFKALLKEVSKITKSDSIVFVLEATGVYHEKLVYYLHGLGFKVVLMQSGRARRYAQSLDQRSKTDALDSRMLSMIGCERELTAWTPPTEEMQELRFLSRERSALIKERTVEKNRNHANERSVFISNASKSRYRKRMKLLNKQIEEVEHEMHQVIKSDEELSCKIKYLISIPGISDITATIVIAETGGFSLFTNAKQLTSFCGYDIVLKESGTYKGQSRMSKKGNKHIRAALYMPALTAVRVNPTLKPFYQRLKPKKAKPIVAVVAVQRKLLCLMYSLWKNECFYDAEFEQKKVARVKALATQDNSIIA